MAVVKSNAYGHGLIGTAKIFEESGADWFGVDSVVEGIALRRAGVKRPILILGYTLPERLRDAHSHDLSVTVSHAEHIRALARFLESAGGSASAKIHIKIDTGLNRQGFCPNGLEEAVALLRASPRIMVEGTYSHFAAAVPSERERSEKQIAAFCAAVAMLCNHGLNLIRHMAATGGTIVFPEAQFDMIRIGIGLYGIFPSDEARAHVPEIKLFPALSWKTIAGETKNIPKGSAVGYNWIEMVSRDSRIAVCPVGYWHGIPRSVSSRVYVLIRGKRAKVLGRVSMDMIVVDITEIHDAEIGDEAVLVGKQGEDEITAYEFASLAETSPYEIITCLNPLIRRMYV